MGEHTIREILKRRSPETQRAMQRRRELAGGGGRSSMIPKLIILVVVLAVLGYVGYLGWQAHLASKDFAARKSARTGQGLTLSGTTEFLPNTLLAAYDPDFYSPSGTKGALLTKRLMRLYHPDAQFPKTDIMENYINDVPMGGSAHPVKGLAEASNYYFGKPFSQIAPQDIALLVALIQDPAGLDPRTAPGKALDAREVVLQDDLKLNVLSEAQVQALSKTPLDVVPQPAP